MQKEDGHEWKYHPTGTRKAEHKKLMKVSRRTVSRILTFETAGENRLRKSTPADSIKEPIKEDRSNKEDRHLTLEMRGIGTELRSDSRHKG